MRLNSGKNIGHFEIVSRLGAGGMGEVYLALVKQLNRKVALKILPETLATNHDRMRRLLRAERSKRHEMALRFTVANL
jgi:serine/threonine protein kinase